MNGACGSDTYPQGVSMSLSILTVLESNKRTASQ